MDWRSRRLKRKGATIGEFSVISPAKFDGNMKHLSIGHHSFVGRVSVQLHEKLEIGNYVCINDCVSIFTASHDVRDVGWALVSRPVMIEDYAWIASGATLLPGITIGYGAVVGAGAVVACDVPAGAVAVGNPAIIRENIRPNDLEYSPESFLATRRAWLGPAA